MLYLQNIGVLRTKLICFEIAVGSVPAWSADVRIKHNERLVQAIF